ncbi:MAG: hypothetical protein Q7K37_00435 [Dehalococcoidia bacterium]|nr:hypothetical protein [Dehalococcoidia bacterium]
MRPRRSRLLVAAAALVGAFLLVLGTVALRDRQAGDRFDLLRWQIDAAPGKVLALLGQPFRDDPDPDEAVRRYFAPGATEADRRAVENAVEAAIEGRIDAVLAELGVNARVPLPASVMPPVNVELAAPPRVLVVSPRDEIRRERVVLLRPDLTLADAEGIEAETEAEDASRAALVVGSGGVATYPAVVVNSGSYAATVETAAHEWVHHYLAFYPLGIRYFTSNDLRTVNETVADIVGEEVAARVLERWGDPTASAPAEAPAGATPTSTPSGTPAVDRDAVLRDLRLEVDALLTAGRIEEAETRMEAVRLELWEAGVRIRRINQAYFAWFGTYAARPDATDPIGAQLRAVRAGSASLPDFLARVRGVGSRGDVETLFEAVTASGAGAGN